MRVVSAAALFLSLSCAADYYAKRTDSICTRCLERAGEGHLCGRTAYCPRCRTDCTTLETHGCYLTRHCPNCGRDVGLYHVCGVTRFCEACKQEVGEGHVCGKTRLCRACRKEVSGPHAHEER